jgi:mRNA-degrading endonuclease HigB of HigAB toxin-antitoxin module
MVFEHKTTATTNNIDVLFRIQHMKDFQKTIVIQYIGQALEQNDLFLSKQDETHIRALRRFEQQVKKNPFVGEHTKKQLIPKKLILTYAITNLFVVDLPRFWRLLYTIESSPEQTTIFILYILTHDEYNKLFGFRKR